MTGPSDELAGQPIPEPGGDGGEAQRRFAAGLTDPLIPRIRRAEDVSEAQTDPFIPRISVPAGRPADSALQDTDVHAALRLPESAEPPVPPGPAEPVQPAELPGPAEPPEAADAAALTAAAAEASPTAEPAPPWWRRRWVLVPVGALVLLGALYAGDLAGASGEIPRNTAVAGVELGGYSPEEAAAVLTRASPDVLAPRTADAAGLSVPVDPASAGVSLDVERSVHAAEQQPLNPITRAVSLFATRPVDAVLTVDEPALDRAVAGFAGQIDVPFVEGSIRIEGTTPEVVAPVKGQALDHPGTARAVQDAVRTGSDGLTFPVDIQQPQVSADEAQQTLDQLVRPALAAPVLLTGQSGTQAELSVPVIASSLRFGPSDDGSLDAWLDPAAVLSGLGAAGAQFVTPPVDATFDVGGASVSVTPSTDGTAIDGPALTHELIGLLPTPAPRQSAVPLMTAKPSLSTDQAQALGIREPVSTFTTSYDDSDAGHNIQLAAERLDAAVVRPGETFSLNGSTGPRSEVEGYVAAADGGAGPATIGEGISPLATAMFNTVLTAGLEPVQRTSHPAYLGDYPAGRDAVVRFDVADLVWRDNDTTGIYLQTHWEPGAVTVTFWGTKHFDVDVVSAAQSNYREPSSQVGTGADCRSTSGSTGFDISITRVLKRPGTDDVLGSEDFTTSYDATPRVVCEGTPEPAPSTEPPPPQPTTSSPAPPPPASSSSPAPTTTPPATTPPTTTVPTTTLPTTTVPTTTLPTTTVPTTTPMTTTPTPTLPWPTTPGGALDHHRT